MRAGVPSLVLAALLLPASASAQTPPTGPTVGMLLGDPAVSPAASCPEVFPQLTQKLPERIAAEATESTPGQFA